MTNKQHVSITENNIQLQGNLTEVPNSKAWVVFAHGSGSSHKSPRNNAVAEKLNQEGFSTLLFDLLTEKEDLYYQNRFNIPLLGERLLMATEWLINSKHYKTATPIAFFGASTGAAAALIAASKALPSIPLYCVVSRGGRPDLAFDALKSVKVATLLIVGGKDFQVIEYNEEADKLLPNSKIAIIEGATHLFEEAGTMEKVISKSIEWFNQNLPSRTRKTEAPATSAWPS